MRMIHLNCKAYRVKGIEKLYQHYIKGTLTKTKKEPIYKLVIHSDFRVNQTECKYILLSQKRGKIT
jgi:hypothetical protein